MKTLSKGRKTPINNFDDLSYSRESISYKRQSKEEILNAKHFYELQNDSLMISHEQTIQLLLRLSNCTTTTDLFCALSYDYIRSKFSKLNVLHQAKWIYFKNVKGFIKRIFNDNDFGIDYSDLLAGNIRNKRFALRKEWTHSLRAFSSDDITIFTNEELYLHFDALQMAQYIETEKHRPSCIDELIIMLVNRAYDELVTYYSNQISIDADFISSIYSGSVRFMTYYEIKELATLYPQYGTTQENRESFRTYLEKYNRHRYEAHQMNVEESKSINKEYIGTFTWYVLYDKFIDYTPFLNSYGKLFNKNLSIEIAHQESERLKQFQKLTDEQKNKYNYNFSNIKRRIKEILE